ncbi:RNA polymerase sigma factor [Paenibacillus gorillae]|uniref:RNA polymerase sigma factor n=1 Tax=Paenibacillus gorillae TaxID=1243662 RepID=UPI0004B24D81|nr:RNA polymerase sigma factor [Paenibacillus gorillae]
MNGWNQEGVEHPAARLGEETTKLLDAALGRYCMAITASRHEAEDLAQETWLKAISKLNGEGHANAEAYLLRIARTTWVDRVRRKARSARLETDSHAADTKAEDDFAEIEALLHVLQKHLSPLQLLVFVLRETMGYSIDATAALLQTSEGAVKAALHRARRSLAVIRKELLSEGLPEPKEEGMKLYIRSLAAAYRLNDTNSLIALVQHDASHAAIAVGLVQNKALQLQQAVREKAIMQHTGPIAGFGVRMAA